MLADQYQYLPSEELLARAEALRAGFALATERWSDEDGAAFAQSLIDLAAADEQAIAPVAFLMTASPGAPSVSAVFAAAAAEAAARHETGQPPTLLVSSGGDVSSRLYMDAMGSDTSLAGSSAEIDLSAAVLGALGSHPEESLAYLGDPAASEHWWSREWSVDGYQGITTIVDAALGVEGGVGFPPTLDPSTVDLDVAEQQARVAESFFGGFGNRVTDPGTLTADARENLARITAGQLPMISELTSISGIDGDFPLLGNEGYRDVPLAHVPNDGLATVLSLIGGEPSWVDLQNEYVDWIGAGVSSGELTSYEAMNSVTGLFAMNAAAQAGSDIATAAAADQAMSYATTVLSLLPPLDGVMTTASIGQTLLEGTGILQDFESLAQAQASAEWQAYTSSFAAEAAAFGIPADQATTLIEGLESRYYGVLTNWP